MPDQYPSMTALYEDPSNVEGTTYGKRWRRHEWVFRSWKVKLLTILKVRRSFSRPSWWRDRGGHERNRSRCCRIPSCYFCSSYRLLWIA